MMEQERRIANPSELFDILSEMNAGKFASICYISTANLNVPKTKGKKDYAAFGKELGEEGEVAGVIKLTRYNLRWSTPETMAKSYSKYKDAFNKLREKFGIPVAEKTNSYKTKVDYGKNSVETYGGENDALKSHVYTSQNVHKSKCKMKSAYYLIGMDGHIIREMDKAELQNYFSAPRQITGVAQLKKMEADDQTIQDYINQEFELGFKQVNFEADSILYVSATVNGEKLVFINNNLSRIVRDDIGIASEDFIKIAEKQYKKSEIEVKQAEQELSSENPMMNESVNKVLLMMEKLELI